MKKLLFILLLTIPFLGFGQGWEQNYNLSIFDMGNSVQQTSDGGYIITGFTSVLEQDIILIKTNSFGDTLWTNKLIETHDQWGNSVKQTNDNGYVICGTREDSLGSGDIWVIKTDSNGVIQWDKTFGGTSYDEGNDIKQTTDGGYIVLGVTKSYGVGNKDVYLIKTDVNGNSLWTKTFGYSGDDIGRSIQQTSDGGYIITGSTSSFGNVDVYLVKTDVNGDSLWTKNFGNGVGHSVQEIVSGGYFITGNYGGYINLIRTDGNGDSLWNTNYNNIPNSWSVGSSIEQTTMGEVIICGYLETFLPIDKRYVYLIKTDLSGNQQWYQTYSNPGYNNIGMEVQQTTDGGFIITGVTDFGNIDSDIYLIKTDGNGNVTSTFNFPTPSSNRKLKKIVDLLGRETKPQQNTPFIEIYDDGSTEKKIVIE